ncbi:hypothetical protein CYMTET_50958 [Cymbomonas tetramitiformis]|uniref:Uncharacterized protein n=1 Tax=Cymbomonas tetramitiformis TaxID=36881 RepID=A0AAE0BNS2_9CHLO|nr:hypothetical protein CYMTET_50958 [Cymbomonas tetramitiformis]
MHDAMAKLLLHIPPLLTIVRLSESRNCQDAESSPRKTRHSDQLGSLDKQFNEVLDRWSSPQDFAKVDLVCAELLKKGSFTDTLKYMERVRGLVEVICAKLRPKALKEAYEAGAAPEEGTGGKSLGGSYQSLQLPTDLPEQPVKKAEPPKKKPVAKRIVLPDTAEMERKAKAREQELQQQIDELSHQLEDVHKSLVDERRSSDKKEVNLAQARDRLVQKTLELQAAETRMIKAEGMASDLQGRVEGLNSLVRQADSTARRETGKARQLKQQILDSHSRQKVLDVVEDKYQTKVEALQLALEKATEDAAVSEAAHASVASKQEKQLKKIKERLESQALELQRRDEILQAMSLKLQESQEHLEGFENGVGPTPPRTATPKVRQAGGEAAAVPANEAAEPKEVATDDKVEASSKASALSPGKALKAKRGPSGRQEKEVSVELPRIVDKKRQAAENAGVYIRITENTGPGMTSKPWVIHQPVRCEPAGHLVIQGVKEIESVEKMEADLAAQSKLCSCGMLASHYFEVLGTVSWKGRSAHIGPRSKGKAADTRGVLGAEDANGPVGNSWF